MGAKVGKDMAVKLGTTTVVGMGTWNMTGVTTELLEDTEFGDEWKTYLAGLKDGGQVTFNGFYDPTDSTGQTLMRTYNENATEVSNLRLYVDANSYWTLSTTSPYSFVIITDWTVGGDKNGLGTASFTGKISGKMVLV